MNRNLLAAGLVIGLIFGWLAFDPPAPRQVSANAAAPPAQKTGAPGENTCIECHSGNTPDDQNGFLFLQGIPNPYTPGQTYQIDVQLIHIAASGKWGFQATALKDSDNTMAGVIDNVNGLTSTQTAAGKTYVGQSTTTPGFDGTYPGFPVAGWSFTWQAPAAGAGGVTFYAAGTVADGTGSATGDYVYTVTEISAEGTSTAVEATTWGKIKSIYR